MLYMEVSHAWALVKVAPKPPKLTNPTCANRVFEISRPFSGSANAMKVPIENGAGQLNK